MWYLNAYYFDKYEGFVYGDICIENGFFSKIVRCGSPEGEYVDLDGARVIPGLVDLHIHGAAGVDFSDGSRDGLMKIAKYLAARGITGFLPTSVSLPYDRLRAALRTADELSKVTWSGLSRVLGIHMEGPFFAESKRGAQNAEFLKLPDAEVFEALQNECGHMIRIVDIAAELPGALDFVRRISGRNTAVSIGHTNADYDQASAAFDAGASHLTHLFNGMPSIHHRAPGVIGAASERDHVTAELICDGMHVHPSAVRLAYKMFPGRICLVSDSLRCCGMQDGEYELGGQKVFLSDGYATLEDGTIAGASSDLFTDMKNAISFGIPSCDAISSATIIPACVAGCSDIVGSIEEGKYADMIITDDNLDIRQVIISGLPVL